MPRPATTTRTSARPSTRATTGEITSIAWMRDSGTRIDWRRISPVVICRSPPWTRQRVTSQETTPATIGQAEQDQALPRERRCAGARVSNCVLKSTSTATALPARTTGDSGCRRVHSVSPGRGCRLAAPRSSEPGGLGLAEGREAVAEAVGLLLGEPGDASVAGGGGGVQLHGREAERRGRSGPR